MVFLIWTTFKCPTNYGFVFICVCSYIARALSLSLSLYFEKHKVAVCLDTFVGGLFGICSSRVRIRKAHLLFFHILCTFILIYFNLSFKPYCGMLVTVCLRTNVCMCVCVFLWIMNRQLSVSSFYWLLFCRLFLRPFIWPGFLNIFAANFIHEKLHSKAFRSIVKLRLLPFHSLLGVSCHLTAFSSQRKAP